VTDFKSNVEAVITGADGGSYAAARADSDSCNAATSPEIGQTNAYNVYRAYLDFDTSALPNGANISKVTLFLKGQADASDTEFVIRVYNYDWAEAVCTNREANWDGVIASGTDVGAFRDTTDGWVTDTWYSAEIATTGVSTTGDTKYVLLSSRDVSATTPTGNEYVSFHGATGAADDPYLQIEYTVAETQAFQWDVAAALGQAAPWWDTDYTYRQVIKIVAPGGEAIPANYTALLSDDVGFLVTATKVQADFDDWRVVYWNGTTNTELDRRFIAGATDQTWFKIQAEIAAGATSYAYFVYYGNAAATDPPDDFVDIYYWGDDVEDNNVTEWGSSLAADATLTSTASSPLSGTYSLLFNGESGNSYIWDGFTATPSGQDVYIEFQIKINETVAPLVRVSIKEGATQACYVDFQADNDIMWRSTDTTANWADNTTYKIRLTGDTSADTWDMHIDDVSKISHPYGGRRSAASIGGTCLSVGSRWDVNHSGHQDIPVGRVGHYHF
jgi:hypothetical protein